MVGVGLKAVFLDRDGVLNEAIIKNGKPHPPATLSELRVTNNALRALQSLKSLGYLLIGITNQPDVARGMTDKSVVEAINNRLLSQLPLDEIFVCYHDNGDNCTCRKPSPGLIFRAATKYHIDLFNSIMIGDRWKDIEAGQRAGCKTVWINRGYQESAPAKPADTVVSSLGEATEWIINTVTKESLTA